MVLHRPALLWCAALVSVILAAGCSSAPAPKQAAAQQSASAAQAPAGTGAPAQSADVTVAAAQPNAYFTDENGTRYTDGSTVTLPTGAPPSGRLYPKAVDPKATLYVTNDGTVPTAENHWAVFKPGETGRFISSLEAKPRVYRIAAIDVPAAGASAASASPGGASATQTPTPAPVGSLSVVWKDEEKPALDAPGFLVDGKPVTAGGSVALPTGGNADPAGRLGITCNYLGATVYITRDGTDPSPKNSWKSGLCDGIYIYSADPFTVTYKVMAVLRGSDSPVSKLTVTWKAK